MKKCPFCAEMIQDEAIFCRFCKRDLSMPKPVVTSEPTHASSMAAFNKLQDEKTSSDSLQPVSFEEAASNDAAGSKADNNKSIIKSPDGVFALGALAYIVSVFFPMASISLLGITKNQSMFEDSWLWLLGFIAFVSIPFGLFEKKHFILSALVCLFHTILPSILYSMMINKEYEFLINRGFGFYLMTGGAVVMLAANIFGLAVKIRSK